MTISIECLFVCFVDSGVSSFNHFVHELSVDYDSIASNAEHLSEDAIDDYDDAYIVPASPLTPTLVFSRAASFAKRERNRRHWIVSIIMFLLIPARIMFGIPFYFCKRIFNKGVRSHTTNYHRRVSSSNATKKALDHVVQRATDRRRGIIEVCSLMHRRCFYSSFETNYSCQWWNNNFLVSGHNKVIFSTDYN